MVAQMLLQCPSDRVFLRRAPPPARAISSPTFRRSRATTSAAGAGAETGAALEGARGRDARRRRRSAPARHDAAALRPVDRDDPAQPARALGRLRLLAQPTRAATGASSSCCSAPRTARSSTSISSPPTRGERDAALTLLEANPIEGATIICDKGFAGADFEAAVRELRALLAATEQTPTSRTGPTRDRLDPATDRVDRPHAQRPALLEQHWPRPPPGSPRASCAHPRALRGHQPQLAARPTATRARRLPRLTGQPSRGWWRGRREVSLRKEREVLAALASRRGGERRDLMSSGIEVYPVHQASEAGDKPRRLAAVVSLQLPVDRPPREVSTALPVSLVEGLLDLPTREPGWSTT